jgi:hypothetical protein
MATWQRICRIRVLAKMAFFRNVSDSPDLPTFAKPCRTDSPDSPTFAEPCRADSPDSPTLAKPCRADSPDSPTLGKGHFREKCDSPQAFARVICHSREFGASGHCLFKIHILHNNGSSLQQNQRLHILQISLTEI